jgi:hypothetical protein
MEDVGKKDGSLIVIHWIPSRSFEAVESTNSRFIVDGVEYTGKIIVVNNIFITVVTTNIRLLRNSIPAGSSGATFATKIR